MPWVVVVLFLVLWVPELPGFAHRKDWREILAFFVLWAIGLALSLLLTYGVKIDSVTRLQRQLLDPLGELIMTQPIR